MTLILFKRKGSIIFVNLFWLLHSTTRYLFYHWVCVGVVWFLFLWNYTVMRLTFLGEKGSLGRGWFARLLFWMFVCFLLLFVLLACFRFVLVFCRTVQVGTTACGYLIVKIHKQFFFRHHCIPGLTSFWQPFVKNTGDGTHQTTTTTVALPTKLSKESSLQLFKMRIL